MDQIQHANRQCKPAWGGLLFIVALMIGAFIYEARHPYSEIGHQVAEVAILLICYGLIYGWLKGNEIAMMYEEDSRRRAELKNLLEPDSPPEKQAGSPRLQKGAIGWLLILISSAVEFFRV